jgi:hypothetical protein
MLIDKCILVLNGVGDASFQYIVTLKNFDNTFENQKVEFTNLMRRVNLGIVGKDYAAKDPQSIEFHYLPTMGRQEIYKRLPYKEPPFSGEVFIYDAFACVGDKFNLKDLAVFVELKYSSMACGILWAEIYYVGDCLVPAMIIRPTFIFLDKIQEKGEN